mmetsp:Transcript_31447/g.75881  ORF Transcript_31447/g.75881 Transcript_31447/m.75881 type:complete len:2497 (-) Transcript_31447:208-7698(-)
MGKKSRKKKNSNKESHQARMQERAARREEERKAAEEEEAEETEKDNQLDYGGKSRPFFDGDLVRYCEPSHSHGMVRGVIRRKVDGSDEELPEGKFQFTAYEENAVAKIVDEEDIYTDLHFTQLRYEVGDRVLCCNKDNPDDDVGEWIQHEVIELWPFPPAVYNWSVLSRSYPLYVCEPEVDLGYLMPVYDGLSEKEIRDIPLSTRFDAGDMVVFNAEMAEGIKLSGRFLGSGWRAGKIVDTIPMKIKQKGRKGPKYTVYLGFYECSFQHKGKVHRCYILEDTDEHIARDDPRTRLWNAIEDDCSMHHISYLVDEYGIDVPSFQDHFFAKAWDLSSFNALLWMEENLGLKLASQLESGGDTMVERLVSSPNILRFLIKSTEYRELDEPNYDYIGVVRKILAGETTQNGNSSFLVSLMRTNIRALDYAISPLAIGHMYCWNLSTQQQQIRDLENSMRSSISQQVLYILRRFNAFRDIDRIARALEEIGWSSSRSTEEVFEGERRELNVKQYIRFCWDYRLVDVGSFQTFCSYRLKERLPKVHYDLKNLAKRRRCFSCFVLMSEEEPSLLSDDRLFTQRASVDHGEYTEITPEEDTETDGYDQLSLVDCVVHGKRSSAASARERSSEIHRYHSSLQHLCGQDSFHPKQLIEMLKKEISRCQGSKFSDCKNFYQYKLHLITDDDDVADQLRLLDYLVKEKGLRYPDPFSAIKWRQSSVIRWLLSNGYIALNGAIEPEFDQYTNILHNDFDSFLPIKEETKNKGFLLCLAAIQYDDIQTLTWMVEEYGVGVLGGNDSGWNLVHVASHFGRIEIMGYLSTLAPFDAFVRETVRDGKYSGWYASHIAVSQGHTIIADLLVARACPLLNANNVSISEMASNSQLVNVRRWELEKNKASKLEKDVEHVFELIKDTSTSLAALKDYVLRSECMKIESWQFDADCWTMRETGNLSYSYSTVLSRCFELGATDFCLWWCTVLYSNWCFDGGFLDYDVYNERSKVVVGIEPLRQVDDAELQTLMQSGWAKENVRVRDYVACPHPLIEAFPEGSFKDRLMLRATKLDAIRLMYRRCLEEIQRSLLLGDCAQALRELIDLPGLLNAKRIQEDAEPFPDKWEIVTHSGRVKLGSELRKSGLEERKSVLIRNHALTRKDSECVYMRLLIDGDCSTVRFCLERKCDFDTSQERKMIYLASCFGRKDVVDILLETDNHYGFTTSQDDRCWYAALGAAESGELADMNGYLEKSVKLRSSDPIMLDFDILWDAFCNENHEASLSPEIEPALSLCYVFVSGFLLRYGMVVGGQDRGDNPAIREIEEMITLGSYEKPHFLLAILWVHQRLYDAKKFTITLTGILCLLDCLSIHHQYSSQERLLLRRLTERIFTWYPNCSEMEGRSSQQLLLSRWVERMSRVGISLPADTKWWNKDDKSFYQTLERKQDDIFQQFDGLKEGCSVKELQNEISVGNINTEACDRSGLYLVHIAAAYDRLDVLVWLIERDIASLDQLDTRGRNVLVVAESSKAKRTTIWIRQRQASLLITSFIRNRLQQKNARRTMTSIRHGILRLQAVCRGWSVRQATRTQLLMHQKSSQLFQLIWGKCVDHAENVTSGSPGWSLLRDSIVDFVKTSNGENSGTNGDINVTVSDDLIETLEMLDTSIQSALDANCEESTATATFTTQTKKPMRNSTAASPNDTAVHKAIQYTPHIVKWLKQGDPKYRDFFVRRITQLAQGERSRILAKRLKGSKVVTIYETYLEQKSGFRILWTEEGDDMLVWYVAKHDNVSRLVRLIDDSKARSNRQLVPAGSFVDPNHVAPSASENEQTNSSRIVLDPMGNVPMKVYQFGGIDEIGHVVEESWTPRLKLTDEERDVVETKGTVLLLGRSGTGKTVCILSRMDYDRQVNMQDSTFTQLFVARSRRVCKYVSESLGQTQNTIGNGNGDATMTNMTFTTFDELLSRLENALPRVENIRDVFRRSERMTFQRFKTEVYTGDKGIDPLLVWACIRSFVKGSIEATTQTDSHVVDRHDFLNLEIFGSRRCRLSVDEQRPIVYDIYEKYQRYMQEYNLWDDCDRIMALLQRLESSKTTAPDIYHQVRKRKIYVDEIQDYTQAECLLFFYLSGPGDLFLAGDPAQSVVEGVEFRFEDIRSVEYHIAKDKSGLLLQKPKTVNVNYRSHAGVLNTAGAILSCMFGAFPHSAKQLKEDRGVFVGPRPGVMYKVSSEMVESVIKTKLKGTVILVHDSSVSRWRRALGGYALVYGIRAAKGLEFKSVMVLGFFGELPGGIHKPWRDLLLGRANDGYQNMYPEVEGHMKLLYTAVTRSIERLFFVETEGSVAGDAFVRWITTTSMARNKHKNGAASQSVAATPLVPLASRNKVDDVESMTMTRDEWLSAGMDNAEAAEVEEDLLAAESLWDKAIYCFREAQDHDLARKARTHRASVRFQMKLPVLKGGDKKGKPVGEDVESEYRLLEVEGASVVESLLCEGLIEEAKNVCLRLIPYMSEESVEHLHRKIMRRL